MYKIRELPVTQIPQIWGRLTKGHPMANGEHPNLLKQGAVKPPEPGLRNDSHGAFAQLRVTPPSYAPKRFALLRSAPLMSIRKLFANLGG